MKLKVVVFVMLAIVFTSAPVFAAKNYSKFISGLKLNDLYSQSELFHKERISSSLGKDSSCDARTDGRHHKVNEMVSVEICVSQNIVYKISFYTFHQGSEIKEEAFRRAMSRVLGGGFSFERREYVSYKSTESEKAKKEIIRKTRDKFVAKMKASS